MNLNNKKINSSYKNLNVIEIKKNFLICQNLSLFSEKLCFLLITLFKKIFVLLICLNNYCYIKLIHCN